MKYLDTIQLNNTYDQFVFGHYISNIRHYNEAIKKCAKNIRLYVRDNHLAKILLSMTGIDVFTAALLSVEIGDIHRFENPRKLVSWAGMSPTPGTPVRWHVIPRQVKKIFKSKHQLGYISVCDSCSHT